MAELKPLKLKAQSAPLTRALASEDPFVRVLVDHQVPHLDRVYEYSLPEELSDSTQVGSLVEVEFGHNLTQGIVLARSPKPESAGQLKQIRKVLSQEPYLLEQQLSLIGVASLLYGASEWDFIRSTVPPFSRQGERKPISTEVSSITPPGSTNLPQSLREFLLKTPLLKCAVEVPISTPYWDVAIKVALELERRGPVLLLVPNERELNLFEGQLKEIGRQVIVIRSGDPKSERYAHYLQARSAENGMILGTRSSALLPVASNGSIILVDDLDESHFERKAPTWNTRELVQLREGANSVVYISPSVSTELADRVDRKEIPLYRFPQSTPPKFSTESTERERNYFPLIQKGLSEGSVLISVLGTGYVTAFSCQKCRNIALCSCGGKLFLPAKGKNPRCATCTLEQIEWKCSWCHESKPRVVSTGIHRYAEEFGRSFPRHPVITSSAGNAVSTLPPGNHLVISTPGVEPRGYYSSQIFLDLEVQLMRTTLRAKEELRLHIFRNLSFLAPGGNVYFSLLPSDSFLQGILRGNSLLAAQREIEERDSVQLPPRFVSILVSGDSIELLSNIFNEIPSVQMIGPFMRNKKKTLLLKAPAAERDKLVQLLTQVNRVQSMRKEPLLTYQINPYSLN